MSLDLTDDKSTVVQVMAWCHSATSHYLSRCWLRFMSSYDVTRPQCVNILTLELLWDFSRSENLKADMSNFLISTLPVDNLALLGVETAYICGDHADVVFVRVRCSLTGRRMKTTFEWMGRQGLSRGKDLPLPSMTPRTKGGIGQGSICICAQPMRDDATL